MSVERQVRTDSTVNLTERGRKIRLPERQPASGRYSTPDMRAAIRPSCGGLHFANGKIAKRAMNSSRRGENIRPSVTSHKGAKVLAKRPPCLVGIEACPPAHHRLGQQPQTDIAVFDFPSVAFHSSFAISSGAIFRLAHQAASLPC
jgi:hypothetical protein